MTKEQLYYDILSHINEGIYVVDNERKILYWNQAAEQISGYAAQEVVDSYCQNNILQHIDQNGKPICMVGCPLLATLHDQKIRVEQVFLRHKDGHRIAVTTRFFPLIEKGSVIGAIEIFTPVSNKVYDDDLAVSFATKAMTDELTKLPNQRYMEEMLDFKIRQYQRFGTQFCIMFMDIDDFSQVNARLGKETGNVILANIGNVLTKQLRKTDLIGRWNGAEFLGIYAITAPDEPYMISEKIRTKIAEFPHTSKEGDMVNVTVSIGTTTMHPDDDVESVVKRAGQLMERSKQTGKNKTTFEV